MCEGVEKVCVCVCVCVCVWVGGWLCVYERLCVCEGVRKGVGMGEAVCVCVCVWVCLNQLLLILTDQSVQHSNGLSLLLGNGRVRHTPS